ncbi:junctional sarcoplasmic reticulum protein 1 [Rhynochetos jubatus]
MSIPQLAQRPQGGEQTAPSPQFMPFGKRLQRDNPNPGAGASRGAGGRRRWWSPRCRCTGEQRRGARGGEDPAWRLCVGSRGAELSMPEPAPLGVDRKAAEKKVGAKGGVAGPPVPKSLPVQRKVEPPSLDPAEEPLLWEGLTLNKCILVASIVALLSVTFQVLQAPCSREGVSHGRQDLPPPPLHEVVSAKKEEVQEVVTAQPAQPTQPESSMFKDDGGDDDDDDDGDNDSDVDNNLAEPWIFKKWFGRLPPEDGDEEPVDVPEVPPAVMEVKKSQEKKLEKKLEKKEEKAQEGRAAQAEQSSRREARAKDRASRDKPGRAPRAPREPEQQPQKKRSREGKESRRDRDEPRKEGWKGRSSRANSGGESPKRDWRQQKGRKPWEPAATPGKDGTARPREGKRRD